MKNKILLTIALTCCLAWSRGQSVFDCQPSSLIPQSQVFTSGSVFAQRCILFGGTNTYQYSNQANDPDLDILLEAVKSITVEPGFEAGEFTSTQGGSMLMEVAGEQPSPFDVAVMNYTHMEGVVQNARLELGVEIPEEYKVQIDEFLDNGSTGQAEQLNPYLSWDIQVTAQFYHINTSNDVHNIQGFHYVPFVRDEPALPSPDIAYTHIITGVENDFGGWVEQPNDYPFRIRFAPPQIGKWVGRVIISVGGNVVVESNVFNFNVVPSSIPPPLEVGTGQRYLKRGKNSFTPLGINLKWPRTNCYFDPELASLLAMDSGEEGEQYKAYTPPVRTYRKYREQIDNLADGGANIFRMIMAPQGSDIEWEELGNYHGRQNIAFELDDILYRAEERNVLIQWNLQLHYPYSDGGSGALIWDWPEDNFPEGWLYQAEKGNPYQELVDVTDPMDFITSESAKKYYKERLRYIIARWGYSNNIACFELFSEIDQIGNVVQNGSTVSCGYTSGGVNNGASGCPWESFMPGNQHNVYLWQKEMIEYMHNDLGHDKHLYMVNYAGDIGIYDKSFTIPEVDFVTKNKYDFRIYHDKDDTEEGVDMFAEFDFHLEITKDILAPLSSHAKPYWLSETGPIPVENGCDDQIEMERSQWKMLFSGVSGSLDWTSDISQQGQFDLFENMWHFFNGVNLYEDRWHPGNVKEIGVANLGPAGAPLIFYNWEHMSNWEKDMERKDHLGDLAYLRKGDETTAFGVITNRRVNYITKGNSIGGCGSSNPCDLSWNSVANQELLAAGPLAASNENLNKLRLRNMKGVKYQIDYYWPHDPYTVVGSSQDWGPMVELEYPDILDTKESYILLFKAYPEKNSSFFGKDDEVVDQLTDESDVIQEVQFTLYPNPSDGLVHLVMSEPLDGMTDISVYDIMGREVHQVNTYDLNTIELNLAELNSGVYFIRLSNGGKSLTNRLVIQ